MSLFKKKTLGAKSHRTIQELQQEYNNLVAMVGDRQYKVRLNEDQIAHLNEEIEEIMHKIDDLQKEGAKQKEKEAGQNILGAVSETLKGNKEEVVNA